MTEAQIKRLAEYAKVKQGDHMGALLVSIGGPWSRQINAALVSRGYLKRYAGMPGLCFITTEGLAALRSHGETT